LGFAVGVGVGVGVGVALGVVDGLGEPAGVPEEVGVSDGVDSLAATSEQPTRTNDSTTAQSRRTTMLGPATKRRD
jgi:hypothetical protein